MTFHPSESKPLIFAGDKMGHLGVLDASQEKPISSVKNEDDDEDEDDPDPALTTLKPHTRTISSMHIHPSKPTFLYTASYDSSIREMDLEKTTSVERYAPQSTSTDEPISSVDMAADDPNCLYWTTLDGTFGRYDLRTPRHDNYAVATWQLSEKKIGGFSLCPSHPYYFATASLDRFMRLWDLRKLSHDNPVPVGEHESRLSVSHAAFNSAGQIATSSYDDTLKIYDFGAKGMASWKAGHALSETEMKPDTVVRHNCQTGRWVTMYVFSCLVCCPPPPPTPSSSNRTMSINSLKSSSNPYPYYLLLTTRANEKQPPPSMATKPPIPHPAFLHRQHEPLRGYLQRLRRPAGPARRRRRHCRSRCSGFPSKQELGCWWDG